MIPYVKATHLTRSARRSGRDCASCREGFPARHGWERVAALTAPCLSVAERVPPRRVEALRGMAGGAGLDLPTLFP